MIAKPCKGDTTRCRALAGLREQCDRGPRAALRRCHGSALPWAGLLRAFSPQEVPPKTAILRGACRNRGEPPEIAGAPESRAQRADCGTQEICGAFDSANSAVCLNFT